MHTFIKLQNKFDVLSGVFFKAVFSQIIYLEELDLVVGGA